MPGVKLLAWSVAINARFPLASMRLLRGPQSCDQNAGENIVPIGLRSASAPVQSNVWLIGPLTLLGVTLAFCYGTTLQMMVTQWLYNNMYHYAFLIPLVSLYMIWERREKFRGLDPKPHYVGGISLLLLGQFMLVAGTKGGLLALAELSFIVNLFGAVLLVLGTRFFKLLFFPIAYLLFMIPAWEILTNQLHFPFQMFAVELGSKLLELVGIPTYHDGVYIQLPNVTLEVAEACSGMNYLIAVIAVVLPAAHLHLPGWRKQVILVVGAIGVAILANPLRVSIIGITSYYGLSDNLHGPFHVLQGMIVSAAGYVAIITGLWILSEPRLAARRLQEETGRTQMMFIPAFSNRQSRYVCLALSCFLLLMGAHLNLADPIPVQLKTELKYFPIEIGQWKGQENTPDYPVFRELRVDQELSRVYRDASGKSVTLYIGFYSSQRQGKELISYKTQDLLDSRASELKVGLDQPNSVTLRRVVHGGTNRKRQILYWYDLDGRVVTDRYLAKGYTVWDAFIKGTTSAAIVIIMTDVYSEVDLDGRLAISETFIREAFPVIRDFLSSTERIGG